MKPAVVLLSGGLDSATVLAIARTMGFQCYAMSFRYGQRHAIELECAASIAQAAQVAHHTVVDIDLRQFGGSALTSDMQVPKGRSLEAMQGCIPSTYVPARNTIFLSFALAWAETLNCSDIFLGVNALDYSGYPDCRPDYIEAFEAMANLATRSGTEAGQRLRLHAPLINMTKADIVREGLQLGVDYSNTCSCYDPGPKGQPGGQFDACLLRAMGFEEIGQADPLMTRWAGLSNA